MCLQYHHLLTSQNTTPYSFFFRDTNGVAKGRRCRLLDPHIPRRMQFSVSLFGSTLPLWLIDTVNPAKPSKPPPRLRDAQTPNALGLARAAAAGVLWITEGEVDALSLLQCGMANVVSVPNGAPVPPKDTCPTLVDVIKVGVLPWLVPARLQTHHMYFV